VIGHPTAKAMENFLPFACLVIAKTMEAYKQISDLEVQNHKLAFIPLEGDC